MNQNSTDSLDSGSLLQRLKQSASNVSRSISFVDSTFRDAHQCLWATRMRTEHMLPVAETLGQCGFSEIEAFGMVQFDACVLHLRQSPFERIRLLAEHIRQTPLRGVVRSNLLRAFNPQPADLSVKFVDLQVECGVRTITFLESLHAWENVAPSISRARQLGVEIVIPLVFNLAPGYDDNFYAELASETVEKFDPETICIFDTTGSLTPERIRTLVPAIRQRIGTRKLELNTHCLTGLGPQVAIEACVKGVDQILTAIEPLANGNSLVGSIGAARDLSILGINHKLDISRIKSVGKHFARIASDLGYPIGQPAEYDPALYETQYAGGALSNLQSQLKEAGLSNRLEEVLEEIAIVRQELGSPPMATPFPALVAAQAVMNVIHKERYLVIPDDVKKYVCGYYGKLRIPINNNVLDKIINRGSSLINIDPPQIEDGLPLLKKNWPKLNDEERMLRWMYGDSLVNKLEPTSTSGEAAHENPLINLISKMAQHHDRHIRIKKKDLDLSIN